jgi:hypothetical protein
VTFAPSCSLQRIQLSASEAESAELERWAAGCSRSIQRPYRVPTVLCHRTHLTVDEIPTMNEALFITSLFNLEIADNLNGGIEILPGLFITNDQATIEEHLTSNLIRAIGTLETNTLRKSKAVIYGVFPEEFYQNLTQLQFLWANMIFVRTFLQSMWLVKDNNVNCELAFLEFPYGTRESSVSSNFLSNLFTKASGEIETTMFTANEIQRAVKLHEAVYTFISDKARNLKHFLQKGNPRIARAFHFLEATRAERNLGTKIADYCTCYEALFSTESTELSHKLAERISSFLALSPDEKMKTYREIKVAYNIRSKVVHGDNLTNNQIENLVAISQGCDHYLRLILSSIVGSEKLKEIFEQKNDSLEDYFARLVLGFEVERGVG